MPGPRVKAIQGMNAVSSRMKATTFRKTTDAAHLFYYLGNLTANDQALDA